MDTLSAWVRILVQNPREVSVSVRGLARWLAFGVVGGEEVIE